MTCDLVDNMNKLSQLQKALELTNDKDLVVGLFILVPVAPVVAFVFAPKVLLNKLV